LAATTIGHSGTAATRVTGEGVLVRQFGELEAVVMDRLWSYHRPVLVREVLDDLAAERPLAYTTVMTVMDNLRRKGWLRRELVGRAYRYEPVQTKDARSALLMREALTGSADKRTALVHFVDQLSAQEADALEAALHSARRDLGE